MTLTIVIALWLIGTFLSISAISEGFTKIPDFDLLTAFPWAGASLFVLELFSNYFKNKQTIKT